MKVIASILAIATIYELIGFISSMINHIGGTMIMSAIGFVLGLILTILVIKLIIKSNKSAKAHNNRVSQAN
jgi:uncharacterized membrane protein required for colicin V production